MSHLTLSEAIRLGAMTSTPAIGGIYAEDGGRCALAAAAEACGIQPMFDRVEKCAFVAYLELEDRFPILKVRVPITCGCDRGINAKEPLMYAIWHRNDAHKMTRAAIADYVEAIEQQQASPVTPEPAVISA